MRGCKQPTITDAAFSHLKGVHTLDMGRCTQITITGAAFEHLQGPISLSIRGCSLSVLAGALEAGLITKEYADFIRKYASDYVAP